MLSLWEINFSSCYLRVKRPDVEDEILKIHLKFDLLVRPFYLAFLKKIKKLKFGMKSVLIGTYYRREESKSFHNMCCLL